MSTAPDRLFAVHRDITFRIYEQWLGWDLGNEKNVVTIYQRKGSLIGLTYYLIDMEMMPAFPCWFVKALSIHIMTGNTITLENSFVIPISIFIFSARMRCSDPASVSDDPVIAYFTSVSNKPKKSQMISYPLFASASIALSKFSCFTRM